MSTMTDATDPQPALAARLTSTLLLSALLRRTAVDAAGQSLGRLSDIIVRLREADSPAVTGRVHRGAAQQCGQQQGAGEPGRKSGLGVCRVGHGAHPRRSWVVVGRSVAE